MAFPKVIIIMFWNICFVKDLAMATVSVRIDDETKKELDEFCKSVGISVSAAINMFVKVTVRENRLPFDVKGCSSRHH